MRRICGYFTVRSHVCKLWENHRLMTRTDFFGLWDQLLSEGMSTVTTDEVESRTGATRNAVYLGVKYAMDRKRLFSPARGLYVVVPSEYRSIGVVPATQFIDPMMNHLGIGYYLGLATAAGELGQPDPRRQWLDALWHDRRRRHCRARSGLLQDHHSRARHPSPRSTSVAAPRRPPPARPF